MRIGYVILATVAICAIAASPAGAMGVSPQQVKSYVANLAGLSRALIGCSPFKGQFNLPGVVSDMRSVHPLPGSDLCGYTQAGPGGFRMECRLNERQRRDLAKGFIKEARAWQQGGGSLTGVVLPPDACQTSP